ncbi:MAG: HAMP domain-containing protein, partial [Rickettsiales bacterium]|nr:HAMP domain-containing protein [Rickettsiales bacterium]
MTKNRYRRFLTSTNISIALLIAVLFSSISTYTLLSRGNAPLYYNSYVISLLILDLILFLSLIIVVSRKLFLIWVSQKNKNYGSRLQNKILIMFSAIASIPTIIVVIAAMLFFNYSIDSWFDKRINTVLDESIEVAESYIIENQNTIKNRAAAMALEINSNVLKYNLLDNKVLFSDILSSLTDLNNLSEAVILHKNQPIARSRLGISLSFETFPENFLKESKNGVFLIPLKANSNKVRAITALSSIPDAYLIVGKYMDDRIIDHISKSKRAALRYSNIKQNITEMEIRFAIIFIIVSMLILFAAIYAGILFSSSFTKPITQLVQATEKARQGIFSIKVTEGPDNDEIAVLSKAFNEMIARISKQQDKLLTAYKEIHEKSKFNETVLSGISTGVISISKDNKVQLINTAGAKLLELDSQKIIAQDINDNIDKKIQIFLPLIHEALHSDSKTSGGELNIKVGQKISTLIVRVIANISNKDSYKCIIAFDDMTDALHAQKDKAWSDVARRIAHEIKNPLTPIYLGAERLKQKYSDQVKDKENFSLYVDTIIRHVKDIGLIIKEFSYFAKMPSPVFTKIHLSNIVKEIALSRQALATKINYTIDVEKNIFALCDETQINQVLTNILKNAEESIEESETGKNNQGLINVSLVKESDKIKLTISDNGKGLEQKIINKLTEPYFTTRNKGTGLGLTIVKKIVDDHKGKLIIK